MEVLNNKQVDERFRKVFANRRHITNLTPVEATDILELVEKWMRLIEERHSRLVDFNPQMKDYDIDSISVGEYNHKQLRLFKQDLENYLNPVTTSQKPVTKKKIVDGRVCDMWCYAYYHLIWELDDKTKCMPMYSRKDTAILSNKLYNIDGKQFSNQYFTYCKVSLVASIRKMNPKRREKLKTAVFALADIYDSKWHIKWWNTSIL